MIDVKHWQEPPDKGREVLIGISLIVVGFYVLKGAIWMML